jgi:hypothetical protein
MIAGDTRLPKRGSIMRSATVVILTCAAVFLVSGCNDSDTSFPVGKSGWQLTVDVGNYPAGTMVFPVHMEIEGHLMSLDSGADAPDGTLLIFAISEGSFENGMKEIQKTTLNGRAVSNLQADNPGTYELSVSYEGQTNPVVSTFTLGE